MFIRHSQAYDLDSTAQLAEDKNIGIPWKTPVPPMYRISPKQVILLENFYLKLEIFTALSLSIRLPLLWYRSWVCLYKKLL